MTMRPHHGNAATRTAASQPAARHSYHSDRSEVVPYSGGAGPLTPFVGTGSIFGGRDPFADFGRMDPFGGPGFGSLMKSFDDMSRGMGMGMDGGSFGGTGMMGMGDGQYACQSFAMCSRVGPDGKVHTERFANSEVGNRAKGIREAQQAYSNSSTGVDKMGLERQLGDRGRKVVRERNRNTMEEKSTEMFKGMDESGRDAFTRDFDAQASHLPQHPRFDPQALMGGGVAGALGYGGGGYAGRGAPALGNAPHRPTASGRR